MCIYMYIYKCRTILIVDQESPEPPRTPEPDPLTRKWGNGLEGRLLGGSWAVISGDIIRVTLLITHIRGLRTPLVTTHEPPSFRELNSLFASYIARDEAA